MKRLIKCETLGIDENKIAKETDLDILKSWFTGLDAEIQRLKIQILKCKLEGFNNIDKDWYLRLYGYKSMMIILKDILINRISKVKKDLHDTRNKTRNERLIDALRQAIGEEEFLIISKTIV